MTSARRSNSLGVRLDVGSSMAMMRAFSNSARGNLDDLALRHLQGLDRRIGADRGIELRQRLRRLGFLLSRGRRTFPLAAVAGRGTCSAPRSARVPAAVPGGSSRSRRDAHRAACAASEPAVDRDGAAVRLHHARHSPQQGGFAGAVLAQQGVDLARADTAAKFRSAPSRPGTSWSTCRFLAVVMCRT